MGALVTGAAVVTGAVLGTVLVTGAAVVVLGAAVVELGTAGNRQRLSDLHCRGQAKLSEAFGRKQVIEQHRTRSQNHGCLRALNTPGVVVPGGRVLFALASSTAVGLVVVGAAVVVVGAAVVMAGDAVAGAAAGNPQCLCQQRPSSLEQAAITEGSLVSSR